MASAEGDGYTVLRDHIGMAAATTLYRSPAYDTLEACDCVGLVTEVPMVVVARQDFEPADISAFVDYVKTNADDLTLANAGIGSASHLCGVLLMQSLFTVPIRGPA